MVPPIIALTEELRDRHLRKVDATLRRLIEAYGGIYRSLEAEQRALEALLQSLPQGQRAARRAYLARIEALARQIAERVAGFAAYTDVEVQRAAREAIGDGLDDALREVQAGFPEPLQPAVRGVWNYLNTDAVETMFGFLGPESPLHVSLVEQLGPQVADRVGDKLLEGIARGWNPRRVAYDLVREGMGEGLTWALRTARTAQLWAYREAHRASDLANADLVRGWIWYAQLDSRVCLSCVHMHGTEHRIEEVLNDHHNGRCSRLRTLVSLRDLGIPVDTEPLTVQRGEEWFRAQPAARQRAMMGSGMHRAWEEGRFDFRDLSVPYDDSVYGEMLREASLKELLGERAQAYYRKAAA